MRIQGETREDREARLKVLAQDVEDEVNCFDEAFTDALLENVLYNHRTIQQSYVKMFVKIMLAVAGQEHSDLRNEQAVKFCKRMKAIFDEEFMGFPCI